MRAEPGEPRRGRREPRRRPEHLPQHRQVPRHQRHPRGERLHRGQPEPLLRRRERERRRAGHQAGVAVPRRRRAAIEPPSRHRRGAIETLWRRRVDGSGPAPSADVPAGVMDVSQCQLVASPSSTLLRLREGEGSAAQDGGAGRVGSGPPRRPSRRRESLLRTAASTVPSRASRAAAGVRAGGRPA